MTSYHIWYINLDARTDRRAGIESELKGIGLYERATRLSAIQHQKGYIGCAMSHIKALQDALISDAEIAIILEDDARWRLPLQTVKTNMEHVMLESFDVCLLGCSIYGFRSEPIPGSLFRRVLAGQTTTGYMIRRSYIPTLIACFERALSALSAGAEYKDASIDHVWKQLQAKDNWIVPVPSWMVQMDSYSDILNKRVSYPFV
jgi:glycosyl transferase family 25